MSTEPHADIWPDDLAADVARKAAVAKALAIWGSPAGKSRMAGALVKMLPPHATYVEPFVGSGAVFFSKAPAKREVISDADPEIAEAFATVKAMNDGDLRLLKALPWESSKATWEKLSASQPTGAVERLHRFLYLAKFSFGRMRGRSYDTTLAGKSTMVAEKLAGYIPRLKGVSIFAGDYEAVALKYDAPETVYYLDPPYAGFNGAVGEADFDEARFAEFLGKLKGKFLLTYGTKGKLPALLKAAGYKIQQVSANRTISTGAGGSAGTSTAEQMTTLVVTNYDPATLAKAAIINADDGVTLTPWEPEATMPTVQKANEAVDAKAVEIHKASPPPMDPAAPEERIVYGEVLVPEDRDSQGDIYSEEVVRQSAYGYLARFGRGSGQGLQHAELLSAEEVQLLESYVAPVDFVLNGRAIKRGTWLMTWRILDDALWDRIKAGEVTGFSIGGMARREPG